MSAQPKIELSIEDYLTFEEHSAVKHEYYRGEIFAMAGTSFDHGTISGNVLASLHGFLRDKPCFIQGSDIKTHIYKNTLFTYPDISVICGKPEYAFNTKHTIVNPKVIIEILSDSTANYDRTTKFALYSQIPSLETYVLIHQNVAKIELFSKINENIWTDSVEIMGIENTFKINSIGFEMPMKEVYFKVEFE